MISNLNKIGTAFLLFFCMSASEIAGQAKLLGLEHFSPQLGDLDLLLENQKIFSGPICLLPTEGAASFMYTQFWHEYDWRIVGKRRIRMSETGDVAFWKVVDKIGFFERFHESRILESWQKFVEFGKKDLDGTITFLMSVWKRPQPGLTRYEADLIPFLVLDILGLEARNIELGKSERALIAFAESDEITKIWIKYELTKANAEGKLPRK